LLVRLDNGSAHQPLSLRGIDLVIRDRSVAAGFPPLSPHKLRHSAITAALDATDGDVRSVRQLSRHASVETLLVYDDRRADVAGKLSQLVASKIDFTRVS
jgi:integrase/recombinase XerC